MGKHIPGRRNSKSEGPEVRKGTVDLSRKKTEEAGEEGWPPRKQL